jgi:hypothetical protein
LDNLFLTGIFVSGQKTLKSMQTKDLIKEMLPQMFDHTADKLESFIINKTNLTKKEKIELLTIIQVHTQETIHRNTPVDFSEFDDSPDAAILGIGVFAKNK